MSFGLRSLKIFRSGLLRGISAGFQQPAHILSKSSKVLMLDA
jgi:hypothetical protein